MNSKTIIKCAICGKAKIIWTCKLKYGAKYCSRACRYEAFKGVAPWCKGKRGIFSEETRKRISESRKGKPTIKGYHLSAESKRKIGNANKGKKWSEARKKEWAKKWSGEASHFWRGGLMQNTKYRKAKQLKDYQDRRARKLNAPGSHTIREWEDLKNRYGNKCAMCGQKVKLTEDHIVPLFKGGSNNIFNIQPLCRRCNTAKRISIMKFSNKISGQTEFIFNKEEHQ